MPRVKGIYDGQKVILTDPVSLPPNTEVEVLIPETASADEEAYWTRLLELGLIQEVRPSYKASPFTPRQVSGKSVSETIIEERR